ncbi:MAG: DUF72 domain-containing protein [Chloroflexi bacterium]|nr:DUF72 domain-containing protein [Chloroflexota bacterium]
MGEVLVGTCSWSSEGLRGTFYPDGIASREMITFYAQHFQLVEVDSTFYHMPRLATFKLWADRTPTGFIFDVKAYRLLTGHDREEEPSADLFHQFSEALEPLAAAGKLGLILFQFPPWFRASDRSRDYIRECRDLLHGRPLAIEFRHGSWLAPGEEEATFDLLRQLELAYVCVDEPQFRGSTVPPVVAATADVAVVRFHGRNYKTWFKRNISVEERFNYLYTSEELAEWGPKIQSLAEQAKQVHVLMNNCYHDYALRNARDMTTLLGQG